MREIVQMIPPWSSGVNVEKRLPEDTGPRDEDMNVSQIALQRNNDWHVWCIRRHWIDRSHTSGRVGWPLHYPLTCLILDKMTDAGWKHGISDGDFDINQSVRWRKRNRKVCHFFNLSLCR